MMRDKSKGWDEMRELGDCLLVRWSFLCSSNEHRAEDTYCWPQREKKGRWKWKLFLGRDRH